LAERSQFSQLPDARPGPVTFDLMEKVDSILSTLTIPKRRSALSAAEITRKDRGKLGIRSARTRARVFLSISIHLAIDKSSARAVIEHADDHATMIRFDRFSSFPTISYSLIIPIIEIHEFRLLEADNRCILSL